MLVDELVTNSRGDYAHRVLNHDIHRVAKPPPAPTRRGGADENENAIHIPVLVYGSRQSALGWFYTLPLDSTQLTPDNGDMENTACHLMLVISLLVLANFLSAPVALAKESKKAPTVSLKYEMLVTGKSPYSLKDRKNLSLHCGGGKGVLITPKWAMTASHCITSRKQQAGQVNVKFTGTHGKPVQIKVDKVVRHDSKDVALLRLVRPVKKEERMPVLLLRETLVGSIKVKKVTGSMVWRGIPAVGKQGNLIVPKKADRRGKAGSSGLVVSSGLPRNKLWASSKKQDIFTPFAV